MNLVTPLPKCRTLSGTILQCASNQLVSEIQEKAKNDSYGVSIALDGCTNVSNQSFLDSTLITSSGEVLVWKAQDVSRECIRMHEVKQKIEEIIQSVREKNIKVMAVITDSHSSYASAWYVVVLNFKIK